MHEALEVTYPGGAGLPQINSWWVSGGTGRLPTLLILRGVAGPMDGYIEIAQEVARWGFHALVHNWQLRGNDPHDEDIETDLRSVFGYLDGRPDVDPARVGLMGFCKGGTFAFIAGRQRPSLKAMVIFHGFCRRKPSEQHLLQPFQLVDAMCSPMFFLHGTEDTQAPMDSMRTLVASLQKRGVQASLHEYEGVEHGFAVRTHPGYNPGAAADAFPRARAFLEQMV